MTITLGFRYKYFPYDMTIMEYMVIGQQGEIFEDNALLLAYGRIYADERGIRKYDPNYSWNRSHIEGVGEDDSDDTPYAAMSYLKKDLKSLLDKKQYEVNKLYYIIEEL